MTPLFTPQFSTQCDQQPQLTPLTEWLGFVGPVVSVWPGSLHYKSKWLIDGPGTGDTGSSRSIYTLITAKGSDGTPQHSSTRLLPLLSSLIPSSLIHPAVEYCLRSGSADRQTGRLRDRRGRRIDCIWDGREEEIERARRVMCYYLHSVRLSGCLEGR